MNHKPLVAILTHSTASDTFCRHWPYFLRAEADLLCVSRENTQCVWPFDPLNPNIPGRNVVMMRSGEESYVKDANHLERFHRVVEAFVMDPRFQPYTSLCVVEYDSIFLMPIPEPEPRKLNAFLCGYAVTEMDGWHASRYFHTPWYMDREAAEDVYDAGHRLLMAKLWEGGFVDRWLGLMVELGMVEWAPTHTFSVNAIDTPDKLLAARIAVKAGAWFIHGVKTPEQLKAVTI